FGVRAGLRFGGGGGWTGRRGGRRHRCLAESVVQIHHDVPSHLPGGTHAAEQAVQDPVPPFGNALGALKGLQGKMPAAFGQKDGELTRNLHLDLVSDRVGRRSFLDDLNVGFHGAFPPARTARGPAVLQGGSYLQKSGQKSTSVGEPLFST